MDLDAEEAITRAFSDHRPPYNRITISERAIKKLNDRIEGPERFWKAVNDMVARGVLTAPQESWNDWELL
jgi:hypothetical protein